jgi:hypothetical protein
VPDRHGLSPKTEVLGKPLGKALIDDFEFILSASGALLVRATAPYAPKLDPQNFLTAKSKKSKKFSFKLLKT